MTGREKEEEGRKGREDKKGEGKRGKREEGRSRERGKGERTKQTSWARSLAGRDRINQDRRKARPSRMTGSGSKERGTGSQPITKPG